MEAVNKPRQVTELSRRIARPGKASSCFFRSGPPSGQRKLLVQITERCDLRCSHCFVSATESGDDTPLERIQRALPNIVRSGISSVTLTGGEPLVHPNFRSIVGSFASEGFEVTVCSNGASIDDDLVRFIASLGVVKFNISMDGLSEQSHGRFRGEHGAHERTMGGLRRLAEAGLLKGILSTPHRLAEAGEFGDLYQLGNDLNAEYVLFNPMSPFGRGNRNQRLRTNDLDMEGLRVDVAHRSQARNPDSATEAVFIRFPNRTLPLGSCVAGDILYAFVNGDVAACPYLVFATDNPGSRHKRDEFIIGNLYTDDDFPERVANYRFHERYRVGDNDQCRSCGHDSECGKGCPAAVIAGGGRIGEVDKEVCPIGRATPVVIRPRSQKTGSAA